MFRNIIKSTKMDGLHYYYHTDFKSDYLGAISCCNLALELINGSFWELEETITIFSEDENFEIFAYMNRFTMEWNFSMHWNGEEGETIYENMSDLKIKIHKGMSA